MRSIYISTKTTLLSLERVLLLLPTTFLPRFSRKPLSLSRKKEKAYSYMDNKSPSKKESKEEARESLIAISNSLPDKIVDSKSVSESKKSDGVAMPNRDQDDKFRSELISISYAESSDVKI